MAKLDYVKNLSDNKKWCWVVHKVLTAQFLIKYVFSLPVIELTTERRIVGGLISSFKMLDSVASGNPLSNISSKSSYTMTTLSLIAASEHSPK